jgi:hypothetical protein
MNGEGSTGLEDIVRRNIAALRAKANLTQQALGDEMFQRGIGWTRETVAQVETTNRRIGLTEAIAVAACLDVPVARLTATGADTVAVGDSRWSTAYLAAAIAGTAGDVFPPESYANPIHRTHEEPVDAQAGEPATIRTTTMPGTSPMELERRRRPRERRLVDPAEPTPTPTPEVRAQIDPSDAPHKAAERIERRLRLRVTADEVDSTAQHLWSRSLEAERERRVSDRHLLTGGSLPTIRGHVSRDLDRELAHEMEKRAEQSATRDPGAPPLTGDEAAWEATRLNIILANKGYSDSDVTRWWNFTRHRELGDQTIAEAWRDGRYSDVSRLIQSLPDRQVTDGGAPGG